MTVDTLFRIMSMTKMPCTVAALQQVEQGNLDLDAPVADYCPEFAEIQVLTGFDSGIPVLRPPARPATVKNLITHTSGLGYWFWSEDLVKWEAASGVPNVVAGSAASFKAPMLADPGNEELPEIDSCVELFPTADAQEREVFDFFGIVFRGHPNLTRILMPDDYVGWPQRRDFPVGGEPVTFTYSEDRFG